MAPVIHCAGSPDLVIVCSYASLNDLIHAIRAVHGTKRQRAVEKKETKRKQSPEGEIRSPGYVKNISMSIVAAFAEEERSQNRMKLLSYLSRYAALLV